MVIAIGICLNDGCDDAELLESGSRGAEGAVWGGGRPRALHAPRLVHHAERASNLICICLCISLAVYVDVDVDVEVYVSVHRNLYRVSISLSISIYV